MPRARVLLLRGFWTDAEALQAAVPEPLAPDGSNTVLYEFIRMPDSSGFGDYTESGIVIPCTYKGEAVNFTAQMYLDCEPPIAGGARSGASRRSTLARRSRSCTIP